MTLSSEEYAAREGAECPACGSDDVEADGDMGVPDGTGCTQDIKCKSCGATWRDCWSLVGYIDLKHGD